MGFENSISFRNWLFWEYIKEYMLNFRVVFLIPIHVFIYLHLDDLYGECR